MLAIILCTKDNGNSRSAQKLKHSATLECMHSVIKHVRAIIQVSKSKTDRTCYIEDIKDD